MSFLAPAAFALALLLPVVVAMYLLKLRRTEQVVSSVYLWRRMVRDVEANAPWQRLRRNLLLLVQLLFLVALILALARPFTWAEGYGRQAAIFILDVSASMSAADVAPNRLEAAKAQARQLVSNFPDEARLTIIAAGEGARVLAASSQDRRQVLQAINSIQVTTGGSNLTAALQLASAIAARQPDTEVILLSDGRVDLPERLALKGRVSYYPIGLNGENQAISLLTLERVPGSGGLSVFTQVTNYSPSPAQRRLEIFVAGTLVNAYDLDLPPGGQQAIITDLATDLDEASPPEARLAEARLSGTDALPLDDQAWAVYRQTQPATVTLVTSGNIFLETALALLPGLEVTTAKMEEWENRSRDESLEGSQPASLPPFHPSTLTIFDSYVPLTGSLPSGNLLFIAPPRSTQYFTVTGTLAEPDLRPVDSAGPLLAHLSLAGVNVLDTVRIPLPEWARTVIAGDTLESNTPLLFAGEVDGRRVAVLAFDLRRSDLPLQIAFPLLLSNLASWLAPRQGSELPVQVSTGTVTSFPTPLEVETVTLQRPDGSRIRLEAQAGQVVLSGLEQLGIYRLNWEGSEPVDFAVNLFSPQESDIEPAGSLPVLGIGSDGKVEALQHARREWWRPLAFLALALLSIEWLVYHRSTLARLFTPLI